MADEKAKVGSLGNQGSCGAWRSVCLNNDAKKRRWPLTNNAANPLSPRDTVRADAAPAQTHMTGGGGGGTDRMKKEHRAGFQAEGQESKGGGVSALVQTIGEVGSGCQKICV